MVQKSLAVTIVLLVLYSAALYVWPTDDYIPQSIQQENSIKIQDFLYRDVPKQHVIIGSSIAAKIDDEVVAGKLYNLAFRGKGVLDGMVVLRASGTLPKAILIETNTLQKEQSVFENDDLLRDGFREMRGALPMLQQKHQPVNKLLLGLDRGAKTAKALLKGDADDASPTTQSTNDDDADASQQAFLDEIVKTRIDEANALLEEDARTSIAKNIQQLQSDVAHFQVQGVTIIFFEMPGNADLMASDGFQYVRNEVRKAFPPNEYAYVADTDSRDYATKDGLHLIPESATRYTSYLLEEFAKLTAK